MDWSMYLETAGVIAEFMVMTSKTCLLSCPKAGSDPVIRNSITAKDMMRPLL
jgi:hypothetical protein